MPFIIAESGASDIPWLVINTENGHRQFAMSVIARNVNTDPTQKSSDEVIGLAESVEINQDGTERFPDGQALELTRGKLLTVLNCNVVTYAKEIVLSADELITNTSDDVEPDNGHIVDENGNEMTLEAHGLKLGSLVEILDPWKRPDMIGKVAVVTHFNRTTKDDVSVTYDDGSLHGDTALIPASHLKLVE